MAHPVASAVRLQTAWVYTASPWHTEATTHTQATRLGSTVEVPATWAAPQAMGATQATEAIVNTRITAVRKPAVPMEALTALDSAVTQALPTVPTRPLTSEGEVVVTAEGPTTRTVSKIGDLILYSACTEPFVR